MHPAAAARSCDDCRVWMYDDKPDAFAPAPLVRGGQRVKRVTRPPCWFCPKQPPDVPEAERSWATAVELTEQNWRAWSHYRECVAVGSFPDDPIVRRNAAVIRAAEDTTEQLRRVQLAVVSGGRGG